MVEIMLTGTIIIIGNGLLLVYLLNNKKKIERELEIYKNRLDKTPSSVKLWVTKENKGDK